MKKSSTQSKLGSKRQNASDLLEVEEDDYYELIDDILHRGVCLEFLNKLNGNGNLANYTIREVVEEYICPQTLNANCSLSSLLFDIQPDYVGKATHYVIHPWNAKFGRLVKALNVIDSMEDDGIRHYYWIDIFGISQNIHKHGYELNLDNQWLFRDEMFRNIRYLISNIGKCVAFLEPINDPLILNSSWCLFECMHAINVGATIKIGVSPDPPGVDNKLDEMIQNFDEYVNKFSVNYKESRTFIEIDREWLDMEVKREHPLGEVYLNDQVSAIFLEWLADRGMDILSEEYDIRKNSKSTTDDLLLDDIKDLTIVTEDIEDSPNSTIQRKNSIFSAGKSFISVTEFKNSMIDIFDVHRNSKSSNQILIIEEDRVLNMKALGNLLDDLQRPDDAKYIFELALNNIESHDNISSELILSLEHDYACLLGKDFQEFALAEKKLRMVLEKRIKLFDSDDNEQVMEVMASLGRLLKARQNSDEAEELFRKVYKFSINKNGSKARETLIICNLLALTLQQNKKMDEAEELFQKLLDTGIEVLGTKDEDVMVWANNLSLLLQDKGKYGKCEKLLRWCLRNAEQALGLLHPQTLTCVYNLGFLLWELDRLRAAESLFLREYNGCKQLYGENHQDTLRSRNNLINFYKSQGRNLEAQKLIGSKTAVLAREPTPNSPNTYYNKTE
jgi:tetratricopeptide (TPR) repeat protein